MIEGILIGLAMLVILQELAACVLFKPFEGMHLGDEEAPMVSVLLAARNEEHEIARSLEALIRQDYPADRLEILVGDDQSEDRTAAVINEFTAKSTRIRSVRVPAEYAALRGKARVIAWLARQSKGEILLITDADTAVNQQWVRTMTGTMVHSPCDLVNGLTVLSESGFQDMEWIYAQGQLKLISDLGKPVTCIGNNMGFSRKAYESLGGYEKIPDSLTEDHALFVQARKRGFTLRQHFGQNARAVSRPAPSWREYLQQRKRWMTGAVRIPPLVLFLQGTQSLFLLWCIGLVFINVTACLILLALRMTFRMIFFHRLGKAAGRRINVLHELWFEISSGLVNLVVFLYYVVPTGIRWKGRNY